MKVVALSGGVGGARFLDGAARATDLVAIVSAAHKVQPGDAITLVLPFDKLHLFDPESGLSLTSRDVVAA